MNEALFMSQKEWQNERSAVSDSERLTYQLIKDGLTLAKERKAELRL